MNNENNISDRATMEFFLQFQHRERISNKKEDVNSKILQDKNKTLIPVRKLLKRLVDAGVFVTHNAMYEPGNIIRSFPPQELTVWEAPSSPHWQPGGSLFLDHPAHIEIAINNGKHQECEGLIAISCTTEHPNRNLLRGPFHNTEEACMALAKFLSESTIRIERPNFLKNE